MARVTRCINFGGGSVLLSMLLLSCSSTPPPEGYYNGAYARPGSGVYADSASRNSGNVAGSSVAVLGVVSAVASLRDFQRKNLATELETLVRAQDVDVAVLPHSRVRVALRSHSQHRLMLDRYKINGKLTEADWGVLRAARLPVRYLLVARIDRDTTTQFHPVKNAMKNSHGDSLSDRQRVSLLHQRSVEVAARVYDISTGAEIWSAAFVSEPVNHNSYTEYTGSSFAGSMATLLTNSFVNGRTGKRYPPAPSASDALHEAFKRIAANVVGRQPGVPLH